MFLVKKNGVEKKEYYLFLFIIKNCQEKKKVLGGSYVKQL